MTTLSIGPSDGKPANDDAGFQISEFGEPADPFGELDDPRVKVMSFIAASKVATAISSAVPDSKMVGVTAGAMIQDWVVQNPEQARQMLTTSKNDVWEASKEIAENLNIEVHGDLKASVDRGLDLSLTSEDGGQQDFHAPAGLVRAIQTHYDDFVDHNPTNNPDDAPVIMPTNGRRRRNNGPGLDQGADLSEGPNGPRDDPASSGNDQFDRYMDRVYEEGPSNDIDANDHQNRRRLGYAAAIAAVVLPNQESLERVMDQKRKLQAELEFDAFNDQQRDLREQESDDNEQDGGGLTRTATRISGPKFGQF